jgi:hypothetical protein
LNSVCIKTGEYDNRIFLNFEEVAIKDADGYSLSKLEKT